MRKWVSVDANNRIVGAFESDIDQQHAQELLFDVDVNDLVGKVFVDGNTVKPDVEAEAYVWRLEQLQQTDWITNASDHPQYEEYLVYRQALRDWPSTPNFPDTRPKLGA